MDHDIFVDQLADISVTGTVVRLDFASLGFQPQSSGQPSLRVAQRIVMPIEGFVQMSDALQRMIGVMLEKGTLTKKEPA
jgi:hypothetical protein